MADDTKADWRLDELRRFGEAERDMELELARLCREIPRLIVELLPAHASQSKINEVVKASGFCRTLIDRVRGGGGMWSAL